MYFNFSKHHKLGHSLSKFLFLADNYQNTLFDPKYTNVHIVELYDVGGLKQKKCGFTSEIFLQLRVTNLTFAKLAKSTFTLAIIRHDRF